jgi:hypothetical protein
MQRTPLAQGGRGNHRKTDRLADEIASNLLLHQSHLNQAETVAARGLRHQKAKPSQFARFAQTRRRETWIPITESTRYPRPGLPGKLRRAIA